MADMPANTEAAAWAEYHLREAVAIVRTQYDDDEALACRWLVMAFVDALGLPEHIAYPIVDYFERVSNPDVAPE